MTARLLRTYLIAVAAFILAVPLLAACADPWPDRPATYQDQVNDNDLASVAMFLVDPERAAQVNGQRLEALLAVQDKALSHEERLAAAQAQLDLELARQKWAGLRYIGAAVAIALAVYLSVLAVVGGLPRILAARKPQPAYIIEAQPSPALPRPPSPAVPQLPARILTPSMAEFAVALAAVGGWRGRDGSYYVRGASGAAERVDYFTEEE